MPEARSEALKNSSGASMFGLIVNISNLLSMAQTEEREWKSEERKNDDGGYEVHIVIEPKVTK
jgi:hypothetical protein